MIPRKINILNLLNKKKSVLLLGPRGVGKTAFIGQILESLKSGNPQYQVQYVDLLQGADFSKYVTKPELLSKEIEEKLKVSKELLVVIDEVQKLPSLLDETQFLIEKYKNQVIFFLTGSSARKLKKSGANLLAGRAINKNLYPLIISELEIDLMRALKFGTMPGIYLDKVDLEIPTLETYVSTYLREEIKQEALARQVERFAKFLDFAAQNNGHSINFTKLGKQIGIHGKTVAEYYSILCDTLIAHELLGWSESVRKQLQQAPKYYFFDCGVLNSLNGYLRIDLREGGVVYGNLFETYIINQIMAINSYQELGLKFFYWRDKDGHEVDLIIARNAFEPLAAIEIKSAKTPSAAECQGFDYFRADYPMVQNICICNANQTFTDNGIKFLPWREISNLKNLISP